MKEITDLNDLTAAMTQATQQFKQKSIWWRGEARVNEKLLPKLYRPEHSKHVETNLCSNFILRAKTLYPECPGWGERDAWLFLMQHYGLATRLLDWTESALIATFFTVIEHSDETGVLWALSPYSFNNNQIDLPLILGPHSEWVRNILAPAFSQDAKSSDLILAINAQHFDVRMMMQQSAFTIHGTKNPLNDLPDSEKFLTQFRIPAKAKASLKSTFQMLGVTKSYLFPDLEHLAKDLMSGERF